MDSVAVALQPSEEAEGEEADEQAHQGQQDAHPGDDVEQHVVDGVRVLSNTQWDALLSLSLSTMNATVMFVI